MIAQNNMAVAEETCELGEKSPSLNGSNGLDPMESPSLNGSNGRGPRGQFGLGNPGGPGNPAGTRRQQLRFLLANTVTEDDLRDIVDRLVKQAKAGDIRPPPSHKSLSRRPRAPSPRTRLSQAPQGGTARRPARSKTQRRNRPVRGNAVSRQLQTRELSRA
jgi:hypothetical protein